ncbi:MAG: MerR family DNA-binding protein, partial [Rothia mucilaginosa]
AHGNRVFDEESISSARFIATCRQAGMSLADIRTILSNPHDHALSIEVMERARVKIENEILGLQLNLEHLDRRIQEHRRQLGDAA